MSVLDKITGIIADISGHPKADVTPDAVLARDLQIDDFGAIEIVITIEDEFGVEISDDQFESAHTPRDLERLVNAATGALATL